MRLDVNDFRVLFQEFPEKPFFVFLRNFNFLDNVTCFGIYIEKEDDFSEDGRAYVSKEDIGPFLPESILAKLKTMSSEEMVSFCDFKRIAQEWANAMERKVILIHQFGSGNQEDASFRTYKYSPSYL